MKKLLFTLTLLFSFLSYSQTDTTQSVLKKETPYFYKNNVGFEIRQYTKKQRTSILLQVVGSGLIFVGSINQDQPLITIGGGVTLLGFSMRVFSYNHLDNASILLDERGVGLAIKINNK